MFAGKASAKEVTRWGVEPVCEEEVGLLLDERNGKRFDLAEGKGPTRTYVICSTPRTGSTLLARALWDAGGFGAPKEYLNPMQIRDWSLRLEQNPIRKLAYGALRGPAVALAGFGGWSDEGLSQRLAEIKKRRTDPYTGWFGLKIHAHHFRQCFLDGERERHEILDAVRWVHITRRDRLGQAISWVKALQTGRWATTQKSKVPPVYSRRQIQWALGKIEAGELFWTQWLAAQGVRPLRLTYEGLVGSPQGVMDEMAEHLGIARRQAPAFDLKRQADDLSARWRRRFLLDA